MLSEQRQIDLHLPKGWNFCTTDELEQIAASILTVQQRVDRYHSFDWAQVKLLAVLGINHIEVLRQPMLKDQPFPYDLPTPDDEYLVKRPDDKEPWEISIGQLFALTEQLSWIDDPKSDKTVFAFPYPEVTVPDGSPSGKTITIVGPPPLLDGYSWQQYRWLTDWMQEYMRCENAKRDSSTARNKFLAILFERDDSRNNDITGLRDNDKIDAELFTDFSPIKWQVILFWWSSLMALLAKKFPRVFKQQEVGKGKRHKTDTPWDFYNSVIATIQKYVGGLSEKDVNTASYGTILQQLEMMAHEAEEMERISKNHKSKK